MLNKFRFKYGRSTDFIPEVDDIFENACTIILIKAYRNMKNDGNYSLEWKETQFSALLIGYMRNIRENEDLGLRIDPENYLYDEDILSGIRDPDTSSRIDIRICGSWVNEKIYYGIEAKILIENRAYKKRPHQLRNRYIETGINNFINEKYSKHMNKACIIGYVIQGNSTNIVNYINNKLINEGRKIEILSNKNTINNHKDCWCSSHTKNNRSNIKLCHIMLTM